MIAASASLLKFALGATALVADASGPFWGKAAFVGVFVVLLLWLVWMPARLISDDDIPPPWWRNARAWAIVVAVIQIAVYAWWG